MFYEDTVEYDVSFLCFYETNVIKHHQAIKLSEIPRWITSYHFTHPTVKSISTKVWLDKQ